MIRHIPQGALALAMSLPLLAGTQAPAMAANVPTSASITLTDSGFSTQAVTIALNGTVMFTNSGTTIHTATTTGGPLPFDTGGLAPGQAASFSLSLPGVYPFNSATDCLNGNSSTQFKCGGGTVTVIDTNANPNASVAPQAAAPAPVAAAPLPATSGAVSQPNAVATITDQGITPGTINIPLGGTVAFVNNSPGTVHTATSNGGPTPVPFDSGGLGPGQSNSLTFATPGQYAYTSATDCIGAANPGFNCGPYFINVGSTGAPAAVVGAAAPASASAAPAVVGNTNVTLDDKNGFTPNTLTIRAGQTVTWTNTGNVVHNVSSNPGYYNAFDSGGLDHNQRYSYNFTIPGTYGYHSSTEPVYTLDPTTGNIILSFQFNGTIVVQ